MKKNLFLLLVLFLGQQAYAQVGDNLLDSSKVHVIHLDFFEPNFWDTLEAHYSALGFGGEKKYIPARMDIDGQILDTVGVRQKGFFSNWGAFGSTKKPLKVDINEFVKGQKFDGLKKFNLANAFEDPSVMRDMMSLEMMRKSGIPAPRTSYAEVWLNNTYWGLYVIIEQVDKTFLDQNFSSKKGNLYKAIGFTNLEWKGTNKDSYKDEIELKTNETADDWSDFIRLMRIANNNPQATFKDSIEAIFDVAGYLKVLAIDIAINNWDSYFGHGRNFYMYNNPDDGLFHWLPWDYNLAWSDLDYDIFLRGSIDPQDPKNLLTNILKVPEYKTMLMDTYCDLLRDNFTMDRLEPIIDSTYQRIRPSFVSSTNEFFSVSKFDSARTYSVNGGGPFGGSSYRGLKPLIASRRIDIDLHLRALGHVCPAAGVLPLQREADFEMSPNPTAGNLNLTLPSDGRATAASVSIFNEIGQGVLYQELGAGKSHTLLLNLPAGVYVVQIVMDGARSARRLLVK